MFDKQVIQMIAEGIRDTLYMTLFSTVIGYVIGLPLELELLQLLFCILRFWFCHRLLKCTWNCSAIRRFWCSCSLSILDFRRLVFPYPQKCAEQWD